MQTKRKAAKQADTVDTRGRKRTRDASVDTLKQEDKSNEPDFRLEMPKTLKGLLVYDWESINKSHQVVRLPSTVTVTDILNRYIADKHSGNDEMMDQTIQGLKLYFNQSLNSLLYRSERKQLDDIHDTYPDKDLTDIYGLEHFLRLFVEMPLLISQSNVDLPTTKYLHSAFVDILKFIADHEKDLAVKDYEAVAS
ncbi:MRG domain-containing protein [Gongronella butleri]|nr:MRG domain-containing protein [Gongronella butleri]